MTFLLSEFQPAKRVSVVGQPPTHLHVLAHGAVAEVAPGLLAQVEERAATTLRVVLRGR